MLGNSLKPPVLRSAALSVSHRHVLSLRQYPESSGDEEETRMQALQMVPGERLPRAAVRTLDVKVGMAAAQ